MNDYIQITIASDEFDDKPQHAIDVLHSVPVKSIVFEIQKEFDLKGSFALWLKRSKQELDINRTLNEQNIKTGAELEFGRKAKRIPGGAAEITGPKRGFFTLDGASETFAVVWQPALIGRSTDSASATTLAVDLTGIDKTKSVSRQHASVSENNGAFTIQRLAEGNPVMIDGTQIGYLSPVPLKHRSVVKIGSVTLTFNIEDNAEYVPKE
jgi:hypothetical protein